MTLRESLHLDDISVEHLTADEITAYVDATADEIDREIVEAHLEICVICAEDVQDLRNVQIPPVRNRKRIWYAVAGFAAAAAAMATILVWNGRTVREAGPSSIATISIGNSDEDRIAAALRSGR